jgi:DNA-binding MarR family transcriptional regulator
MRGLTVKQSEVLALLADGMRHPVGELARMIGTTRRSVHQFLDALEDKGFATSKLGRVVPDGCITRVAKALKVPQ